MTPTELIDAVEAMIDDCAAVANPALAERLSVALRTLSDAAEARGFAIRYRLLGDIEDAMRHEGQCDTYVADAVAILEALS
jgi:hypothetical protein